MLKQDRERLGAVNLRADDELVDIDKKHEELVAERGVSQLVSVDLAEAEVLIAAE